MTLPNVDRSGRNQLARKIRAVQERELSLNDLIDNHAIKLRKTADLGLRAVCDWLLRDFGSDDLTDQTALEEYFATECPLTAIVEFLESEECDGRVLNRILRGSS